MKSFSRMLLVALGLFGALSASAETITLLETPNLTTPPSILNFVDSANPSISLGTVTITGLQAGEVITAIDYRPSNGQLYGIGTISPSTSVQLYRIDITTGAATAVGSSFTLPAGVAVGMDFNPVVDLIRLIGNTGVNLRVNPDTGAVITDTFVDYAPGDPNAGTGNSPNALAYTPNSGGSTTLYGINYANTVILVTLPSPNNGQMTTVGGTGINNYFNQQTGLDISPGGTAYATIDSPVRLYTINLGTGAATLVGSLPNSRTRDLAVGGAPPVIVNNTPTVPALSPAMLVLLAAALGAVALLAMRRL